MVRFVIFTLDNEWLRGDCVELQSIVTSAEETVSLGYFPHKSGLMGTSHERHGSFWNALSI
jgi:hypothetical protein